MKALMLILMLPALMLIGCGKMESNETSAGNALEQLSSNGALSEEEANSVNENLLDESIQMTETSPNSILMKVGGAELLIDFIEEVTGNPADTAMVINGVDVPVSVVSDPESFKGLIATLVTSQLEGVDIFGIAATDLVQVGLKLINGDADKADFSNLFGTIIRGALNMFAGNSPVGAIISTLAGPILENVLGGGQSNSGQSNNNNSNNNSSGNLLGNIVNAIGGSVGGNNSNSFGGLFSLITNLFK